MLKKDVQPWQRKRIELSINTKRKYDDEIQSYLRRFPTLRSFPRELFEETVVSLYLLDKLHEQGPDIYLDIIGRQRAIGLDGARLIGIDEARNLCSHLTYYMRYQDYCDTLAALIVARNFSYTKEAKRLMNAVGQRLNGIHDTETIFQHIIERRLITEVYEQSDRNQKMLQNASRMGVDFDQLLIGELPLGTLDNFFSQRTFRERSLIVTASLLRTLARRDPVVGNVPTTATLNRYRTLYHHLKSDRISEDFYKDELCRSHLIDNAFPQEVAFTAMRLNLMLGHEPKDAIASAEYLQQTSPAFTGLISEFGVSGVASELGGGFAIIPYKMASVLRSYEKWFIENKYDNPALYAYTACLEDLQAGIVNVRVDSLADEMYEYAPFYLADLSDQILSAHKITINLPF